MLTARAAVDCNPASVWDELRTFSGARRACPLLGRVTSRVGEILYDNKHCNGWELADIVNMLAFTICVLAAEPPSIEFIA
jgi:hypothetical protein